MAEDIIYDVEEPEDDETGDGSVVDGSTGGGVTGGGVTGGGSTGSGTSESEIPYTVPGMSYVPLISGGKKDNSTWLSEQGVDFDKEYAEGKAALDYDYMTSMATYGQRAEELYQMGLSGSGVSDIYQLGAFSEHIQAQNDLRLAIIDKKKQYSKLYNDYSNEWDRNYKTDYGNAYNTGLSMYTGQNIDAVSQQLTSQGYDASIVEQVVSSLSAIDPATLPTVKAFNTEVNKAYAAGYELYRAAKKADGTVENNADEVYNKLLAAGYSAEAAAKAKEMLLDIPESDWANLPTVKAQQDQDKADITAAVSMWGANYTSKDEQKIRDFYKEDWSEEKINTLIDKLNSFAAVVAPSEEDIAAIIKDGAQKLAAITDENGNVIYDGSESSKTVLRQLMDNAEYAAYAPYIDEIIAKMDENKGELASSMVDSDINKETGTVTTDELGESLGAVEDAYGKDSPAYIEEQGRVSKKTLETLNWALEADDDGTPKRLGNSEVGELLGFDPEDWESKDAEEQEDAIMQYAGELRQSGQLTADDYNRFIDKIVGNEIKDIIKTDKGDAPATGLTSAGLVVSKLLSYKDNGYLTDDEYNYYVRRVVNKMGFNMNSKGEINWYKSVDGAEASLVLGNAWSLPLVKDKTVIQTLEDKFKESNVNIYCNVETGESFFTSEHSLYLMSHEGKIYARSFNKESSGLGSWFEVDANNLLVWGDNVWNTDAMKHGIYELVACVLE